MEKEAFDRTRLISSLVKIGHGNLNEFKNIGIPAVKADPELFAHLTAWNAKKSKVLDSKVAFPIIALRCDKTFHENALACLCKLGPRELYRAYNFSKQLTATGLPLVADAGKDFRSVTKRYLDIREEDKSWWDSCVVRNKKAMKGLYAVSHKKPSPYAQQVLFRKIYPAGSVFHAIKNLKSMSPKEAAGNIIIHKIPLTVAIGAVSSIKDEDILLALLENITGNELMKNTNLFEKLGAFEKPALKAAYDAAIERAKKDTKVNTYQGSKSVQKVTDCNLQKKILSIQESREAAQKKIKGDWVILADRSYSMQKYIDLSRKIAALLASRIEGKLHLIFFNDTARYFDVTGFSYDQILKVTQYINATNGTIIGGGVAYLAKKKIPVDGIIIVSDGGDCLTDWYDKTATSFKFFYEQYAKEFDFHPMVYHVVLPGDPNRLASLHYVEKINLSNNFDEYCFDNLVNVIKSDTYILLDEIMRTKLLILNEVFERRKYG